jgi:hypothetical protein
MKGKRVPEYWRGKSYFKPLTISLATSHFRERPPFQREIGAHKKFGGSIKETVSLAKHVDSPTSVRTER